MTVFDLDLDELEYGFRMDGPFEPQSGHRFDKSKVLLDPTARSIRRLGDWGEAANCSHSYSYRARIVARDFDWEETHPLHLPTNDLVVYEMHVRGFTCSPSSGVKRLGTFTGLREKIPYLKHLGINCVELLPVFEFDETNGGWRNPMNGEPLRNYWGYNTIGFFAPHAAYAASGGAGT